MPIYRIPDPEYIHETIEGAVYDLPEGTTLVGGTAHPADYVSLQPRLSGVLILRYGITLQMPASQALIPGLFVSERGAALVGREAWDFMLANFQLYPRADVVGIKALGGAPLQVFLRELDFGAAVRVFVYESVDTTMLPVEVSHLIVDDATVELPELLGTLLTPS